MIQERPEQEENIVLHCKYDIKSGHESESIQLR